MSSPPGRHNLLAEVLLSDAGVTVDAQVAGQLGTTPSPSLPLRPPVVADVVLDGEQWAQKACHAFFESLPDAVVVIGAHGEMALVNAQTEALFGYPRGGLVGHAVEMLLPERLADAFAARRRDPTTQPETGAVGAEPELFGRHADGAEFPIDITLAPLDAGGGRLLALTVRHPVERLGADQALSESEERFRLLVDGVHNYSILSLDVKGAHRELEPRGRAHHWLPF